MLCTIIKSAPQWPVNHHTNCISLQTIAASVSLGYDSYTAPKICSDIATARSRPVFMHYCSLVSYVVVVDNRLLLLNPNACCDTSPTNSTVIKMCTRVLFFPWVGSHKYMNIGRSHDFCSAAPLRGTQMAGVVVFFDPL